MVSHPRLKLASNPFALRAGGGILPFPSMARPPMACPGQRWLRLGLRPRPPPSSCKFLLQPPRAGPRASRLRRSAAALADFARWAGRCAGFAKAPTLRRRNARLPRQEHGESFARLRGRPVGEAQAGRGILSGRCCCCCAGGVGIAGRESPPPPSCS